MAQDEKATYYDVGGIEVLAVIKAKLTHEQWVGWLLGNVIKYSCRMNHKGSAERDAEKTRFYAAQLEEALKETRPLTSAVEQLKKLKAWLEETGQCHGCSEAVCDNCDGLPHRGGSR